MRSDTYQTLYTGNSSPKFLQLFCQFNREVLILHSDCASLDAQSWSISLSIMEEQSSRNLSTPFRKLEDYLKSNGLRVTSERFAILEKALELKAHFGSGDLVRAFRSGDYPISRATIFNTLGILCDSGILRRHQFMPNNTRYEVAEGNHLHLVCSNCGKIIEAESPVLSHNLFSSVAPGFSPTYFSATVYGLCADCSRKENDTKHHKTNKS